MHNDNRFLYLTLDGVYGFVMGIGKQDLADYPGKFIVMDEAVVLPKEILSGAKPLASLFEKGSVSSLYNSRFYGEPHLEGSSVPKINKSTLIKQYSAPLSDIQDSNPVGSDEGLTDA